MDSDSDDDLEEISFLPKQSESPSSSFGVSAIRSNESLVSSVKTSSCKLDALLTEHREETAKTERLQKIVADLQNDFTPNSSQEVNEQQDEKPLCPELEKVIDDLNIKSTELPSLHPTLQIFCQDNFCRLFGEDVHPFTWGFTPLNSEIDKILADIRPDRLVNFLLSEVLPTCFHKVSSVQTIMIWLFSIVSIHSSDLTVEASSRNMMSILRKLKVSQTPNGQTGSWCPTPLQLLAVFVNMGVDPSELLFGYRLYTDEDIRKYLASLDKGNKNQEKTACGSISLNNCQQLFDILARCLQSKPNFNRDELDAILLMIMKVSLDQAFKNLDLQRLFQVCISSILECYSESDWPDVVPELCEHISNIPHHHHSAVYLAELLPIGERGKYLQIRLSFLMLCNILETKQKKKLSSLHLPNISYVLIAGLGDSPLEKSSSELTKALRCLSNSDVYKMRSALHLLDRAAGDEINRCKQPKDELDYLISQVKEVIKGIRDNVFGLELSRIKDIMTYMTFKWTMVSAQNSRFVQRSIFQWVTATSYAPVKEVVLEDSQSQSSEEEMEEGK